MKRLLFLLLPFLFLRPEPVSAAIVPPASAIEKVVNMPIRDIQKAIGRRLTLKEKLAVKYLQWKLKHSRKKEKDDSRLGQTSMTLGIVGLGLLLVPFGGAIASLVCSILAITMGNRALRQNKDDHKAKTGVILGWIGVGLLILALILVIALIASWSGGWG